MAVEFKSYLRGDRHDEVSVSVTLPSLPERHGEAALIAEIVARVAERYVQEHYPEIAAKLDQQAIANLAIAESAQRIAKTIHERPVASGSKVQTTINKRSIF